MLDTIKYSLEFGALIFLNLFFILAIIAIIILIGVFQSIKDKVDETGDKIQETLGNVSNTSFSISQIIASFIRPRPINIWDKLKKFF